MPAITGTVFQDFNANGQLDSISTINNNGTGTVGVAQDAGVPGVSVTVFNDAGLVGNTTTNAAGQFTVPTPGAGTYRVEFTTLPAGLSPGAKGPSVGATVQFVADGATVNLGLVRPEEYSPNNPTLVTSIYYFGDPQATAGTNGSSANQPAVVSFPYSAGTGPADSSMPNQTNPTTRALNVPANQVGSVFGLAASQTNVYAAAFMKRHVGFGPNGPGALYMMGTTGSTANLFTTLNAGIDPHNTADYSTDNFNTSWDAVGKLGLGGMDISSDGSTLYVMNLFDRKLYAISTANPANQASVPVPLTLPSSTGINDVRPFAVTSYRGRVYIGLVNDAESTQTRNDLVAYVYSAPVNGLSIGTFGLDLQVPLNYPRTFLQPLGTSTAALWEPWQTTFDANVKATFSGGLAGYPQPWLTTIAFDPQGNMVLGLRDRTGDQGGFGVAEDPNSPFDLFNVVTGGDTLRAAINTPNNLASGWTLENNGTVGGHTSAGAGNGQGPGGGEFYFQDDKPAVTHTEVGMGGVLQVPGFPDVATTAFDAARAGALNTGGVHWYNNTTGALDKGYQLYATSTVGNTFGTAGGLGELMALPVPAPIEIGDRVWLDNDGDGIQDPSEPGLAGVTVHLYQGGNPTPVATTTTDANGSYLFTNLLPNTAYTVCLDNAADATGTGPLAGKVLTVESQGSDGRLDSNGAFVNGFPCISFTTGGPGANDHTLDIGFVTPGELFGYVYVDRNHNGRRDAKERGVRNVRMTLSGTAYAGTALARPLVAADIPGGLVVRTDITGLWRFHHLPPGIYQVVQKQPAGYSNGRLEITDPSVNGVVLGRNLFSNIDTAIFPTVGELNFGERFLVVAALNKPMRHAHGHARE